MYASVLLFLLCVFLFQQSLLTLMFRKLKYFTIPGALKFPLEFDWTAQKQRLQNLQLFPIFLFCPHCTWKLILKNVCSRNKRTIRHKSQADRGSWSNIFCLLYSQRALQVLSQNNSNSTFFSMKEPQCSLNNDSEKFVLFYFLIRSPFMRMLDKFYSSEYLDLSVIL